MKLILHKATKKATTKNNKLKSNEKTLKSKEKNPRLPRYGRQGQPNQHQQKLMVVQFYGLCDLNVVDFSVKRL